MKDWYSCKVKYTKIDQTGKDEKVSETYLLDAISYTDAEAKINHAMEENVRGEFAVTNISKTNVSEIINFDDADVWYKIKVTMITYDEESEKEKKSNNYFLVAANSIKESCDKIEESLRDTMYDYMISAASATTIMDVFMFDDEAPAAPAGNFLDDMAAVTAMVGNAFPGTENKEESNEETVVAETTDNDEVVAEVEDETEED